MKIFKDKFVEWLDLEIEKEPANSFRKQTLQQVKDKLNDVIKEEYTKILESKKADA
jgi:hypothetical protein